MEKEKDLQVLLLSLFFFCFMKDESLWRDTQHAIVGGNGAIQTLLCSSRRVHTEQTSVMLAVSWNGFLAVLQLSNRRLQPGRAWLYLSLLCLLLRRETEGEDYRTTGGLQTMAKNKLMSFVVFLLGFSNTRVKPCCFNWRTWALELSRYVTQKYILKGFGEY